MAEEIKIVASAVGFDQVNKALDSTTKSLTETSQAATKAGKSLSTDLKNSTSSASNAVTNLSRIVSDSAYGIIGIANNIQPFFDSLGYARKEAQATGTSLEKNLLSVLSGPSGLSLAFAAVTTAITFSQIGLSAWTRGSKDAVSSVDSMSESTRNLSIDIKTLGEDLKTLKSQLDNIKEVKSLEFDIKFGQGFQTDLKLAQLDVTQLGYAQSSANIEFQHAKKDLNDAQAALYSFTQTQQGSFSSTNEFADAVNKLGDLTNISSANLSGFSDEQKAYIQNVIDASKAVNKQRDIYDSYWHTIDIAKLKVEALNAAEKRRLDELKKAQPAFERDLKFKPVKVEKFEVRTKELQKQIQDSLTELKPIEIPELPELPEIPLNFEISQDKLDQLNQVFTDAANNIAVGFGQTLGNALTGNASIGDFFTGLFEQVGEAMISFGKLMIKFAINVEVIKKFLLKNPYLAIAGGVALIALGTLLKNATNRPAFAVGTRYAPGGMALVGERGPEMINLPRGSQVLPAAQTARMMGGVGGSIEVFGMLRGQDIYFSNKKYSQTYNRTT